MASPDVSMYAISQKSTVRIWQVGDSRRCSKRARKFGEESIVIRPESRTWHSAARYSHTAPISGSSDTIFGVLRQRKGTTLHLIRAGGDGSCWKKVPHFGSNTRLICRLS